MNVGVREPDTLSVMLDDIRLSGAQLVDLALAPGAPLVFAAPNRAVIYIVREGEAWLRRGDAAPERLGPADLAMVTTREKQVLSLDPEGAGDAAADIGEVMAGKGRLAEPAGTAARVTCGAFRYDANFAAPLIAALPPLIRFAGAGDEAPAWLMLGLAFLEQERAQPRPAHQAVVNRLLDILMIECLRDQIDRLPPDAASWLGALRDPQISPALAAIHGDPSRNWTVPELASRVNLSRSAFAARFTARLGQSPMAYITSHRLRIAARQLRQGSTPVKSIAAGLGYESTVGFTQAFRREFGYPPSALRRPGAAP